MDWPRRCLPKLASPRRVPDESSSRAALLGGESGRTLVALGAAVGLGVAIAWSGNEGLMRATGMLSIVGTLWVNAIRMTVIPLVVALLITGVTSVADVRDMGRLGGRTLLVFGAMLIGSALLSLAVAVPVFGLFPEAMLGKVPLPSGAAEAAAQVTQAQAGGVLEWFTGLIPVNPVAAAASGNMVSLIVFVFLFSLAIARSPQATRQPLEAFFKSLGEAMLQLVRWIVALAPVAVFCLVLPLAAQSGASLVGAVGFYVAAFAITCAVVTAACHLVAAIAGHRPRPFAQAMIPTQLIGISCSSSIASLPAMVQSADRLGVPARVSGFVLPLAVSVFKPAAPVAWIVGALFIGKFYDISLGVRELGIVAAASVFLSFAAPGVPRGAFLLLTPLFVAIGLPAEGIGVLIAVDLIPDMCATVVNVTGDVTATTVVAKTA